MRVKGLLFGVLAVSMAVAGCGSGGGDTEPARPSEPSASSLGEPSRPAGTTPAPAGGVQAGGEVRLGAPQVTR
jgi:hypothetical protein